MSRGGARPGAGRKAEATGARVPFNCRVATTTSAKIKELRSLGVNIGTLIDQFVSKIDIGTL